MSEMRYDIVIVGGSLEGTAAAWSAAQYGASVCLIEATGRLGGRYSAQRANPTVENPALEMAGDTHAYQVFREAVKGCYSNADSFFSSGAAQLPSPAGLTMVPPVAHEILSLLLATLPNVHVRVYTKVSRVETHGDTMMSITAVDPIESTRCLASYFLDATDFGDVQPEGSQTGIDSASETPRKTSSPHGVAQYLSQARPRRLRGTSVLPDQNAPWQFGVSVAF